MSKITKESFIAALKEMNIKEVMELVEALKEEFGVDPTVAVAAAGPVGETKAEKTEVTLKLIAPGQAKVEIIKLVKDIAGVGLMDAKKLVDSAPVVLKENIKPEEAEDIKAKLVAAGAEVSVE